MNRQLRIAVATHLPASSVVFRVETCEAQFVFEVA